VLNVFEYVCDSTRLVKWSSTKTYTSTKHNYISLFSKTVLL